MKIVLTGRMAQTRLAESNRFENYGISVMKKVTGTTDYLVTGSAPGGSKLRDARIHGTKILTEDAFFDMLVETMPEFLL